MKHFAFCLLLPFINKLTKNNLPKRNYGLRFAQFIAVILAVCMWTASYKTDIFDTSRSCKYYGWFIIIASIPTLYMWISS